MLQRIAEVVKEAIPFNPSISIDLNEAEYHHIASSDQRPDIVRWDDAAKLMTMIEVTVTDTLMEEAAIHKTMYVLIRMQCWSSSHCSSIMTFLDLDL